MAVKIRLQRLGRKKRPFYRIVVMDSRNPRNGQCIECIGKYDPGLDPVFCEVDQQRAEYWLSVGGQVTDVVQRLFPFSRVFPIHPADAPAADDLAHLGREIPHGDRASRGNVEHALEISLDHAPYEARDIGHVD